MKTESIIQKSTFYGWTATTRITFAENRIVKITTNKNSRGFIQSHATAQRIEGDSLVFYPFSDFSKTVRVMDKKVMATEKAIHAFHNETLKLIPSILAEMNAHYNEKQAT